MSLIIGLYFVMSWGKLRLKVDWRVAIKCILTYIILIIAPSHIDLVNVFSYSVSSFFIITAIFSQG